jgi:putative Mg2+ transporter-C (MgtC) family protein
MIGNVELLRRLLLAAMRGSVIGFERERLNWAAGLRTHARVRWLGVDHARISIRIRGLTVAENVVLDPARVAAQVVSGIGFLGAGSMLLRGEIVRGLTTAASLWSVAGVGLAVGGGM